MDIKDFWIDLASNTITVGANTMRVPPGLLPKAEVEAWGFQAATWTLRIRLPGGHEVEAELPRRSGDPDDNRLVVYLDQNHWSLLARARSSPLRGDGRQRQAAAALEDLVTSRSIVVPASGGNFVETVPLYGQRRVDLAQTMLGVSRGWQMRHPLDMRRIELRACLSGEPAVVADVFAPGADSAFAFDASTTGAMDLPDWLSEVASHVPRILGLYEVLVEPAPIKEHGELAEQLAASWAAAFAELSARLAADRASREQAWRAVHATMLIDMHDDVIAAASDVAMSPEEAVTRLCATDDPLARAPYLARLRAWLFARVRNTQQRWESNDLVDGMYLCCAAGYADLVAGERNAIGYLRQIRDVPAGGALLVTSLSDGISVLHR